MTETVEILRGRLPLVAIVGRPNVGKSSLFNRIVGRRKAVVLETPGLTRDRNFEPAEWGGRHFTVCDTGGYEVEGIESGAGPLKEEMREQALLAIEEADVVVLMVDGRESINPIDEEVHAILRRAKKPMILAANKCDNPKLETGALEFYAMGVDHVYPISALHGGGVGDLLDAIIAALPPCEELGDEEIADGGIHVAIIGRQNVGKSTLTNTLLGQERVIASEVPGTTRDSIDTAIRRGDQIYTLIDTAGLRRRGKIQRGIEGLSVISAKASLARCHVALVVIDAEEGLTAQDAHIAGFAAEARRGIGIIVNKWDAVAKDSSTTGKWVKQLRSDWAFLNWAPIQFVSAKSGQRVGKLFEMINSIHEQFTAQISTRGLNKALAEMLTHQPPPIRSGQQIKIKYITQVATKPPTFALFVNNTKLMHFSYERYLHNQIRQRWPLEGSPIRLLLRAKSPPREE